MGQVVSTQIRLWRVSELDSSGGLAYRWKATTMRTRVRRSWTEGILRAHLEEGVSRVGPEVEGFAAAAAVLAEVVALTGRLPLLVDLRFEVPPSEPTEDPREG